MIAIVGGIGALSSLSIVRGYHLRDALGLSQPGALWRIFAIIFAVLNLKSLPFGWHMRMLRGFLTHISLSRRRVPPGPGPSALFQPLITSTRCSLLEVDYNLHKSNSTYFSDLDVARTHLVASVLARGIHRATFGETGADAESMGTQEIEQPSGTTAGSTARRDSGTPGETKRVGVILGGVTCSFRREIKPYQKYEIWTRVLAWDRKWLYVVSHIVKSGTVLPAGYTLQPWRNDSSSTGSMASSPESSGNGMVQDTASKSAWSTQKESAAIHPAILATSIAKYVWKRGRLTIPPEEILEFAGMLPPRPKDGEAGVGGAGINDATDSAGAKDLWDWARVEKERARGMLVAQHMADLEMLHDEFSGDGATILGRW